MWRWLAEMFHIRMTPPDERSVKDAELREKAVEIRELGTEVRRTDRRINAIRSEAMQAEQRFRR